MLLLFSIRIAEWIKRFFFFFFFFFLLLFFFRGEGGDLFIQFTVLVCRQSLSI